VARAARALAPVRRPAAPPRRAAAAVEAHGTTLGASTVWLETTSVNVPGVEAYGRLGYLLCGADVTVYDTLPYADEAAIYLSKSLT